MKCPNCKVELSESRDCPRCGFIGTKNHMKIKELHAFVSVDDQENEGIIAGEFLGLGKLPLVTGDVKIIPLFTPLAERVRDSGTKVKLLKFSKREELEW